MTSEEMTRKSVIMEPEYELNEHYNLLRFDNFGDFTQICWRIRGFLIRIDSTKKDNSIWQWKF